MAPSETTPLSPAAAPETSPADLEKGNGNHTHADNDFSPWYYICYAFSLLVIAMGFWESQRDPAQVRHPHLAKVITAGSFTTGSFLLLNADLIVTYMRLKAEALAFKAHNLAYKTNLRAQKQEITRLRELKKAINILDNKFGGELDKASVELDNLKGNMKGSVISTVKQLTMAFNMKEVKAEQMSDFLERVTDLYIRVFADMPKRMEEAQRGMCGSDKYWKDRAMDPMRLGRIVEEAMFEDIDTIANTTKDIADSEESHSS